MLVGDLPLAFGQEEKSYARRSICRFYRRLYHCLSVWNARGTGGTADERGRLERTKRPRPGNIDCRARFRSGHAGDRRYPLSGKRRSRTTDRNEQELSRVHGHTAG
jgi:hypothetical protein